MNLDINLRGASTGLLQITQGCTLVTIGSYVLDFLHKVEIDLQVHSGRQMLVLYITGCCGS